MTVKQTWNQKIEKSKAHKVKRLDKNFAGMKAGQMMLVPSAKLLDKFIQSVPEGQITDVVTLRQSLAAQHQADITCPIATGFGLIIVAEAAFEKLNQGISAAKVTPVWRVLDQESPTLNKVSFDKTIFLDLRNSEMN